MIRAATSSSGPRAIRLAVALRCLFITPPTAHFPKARVASAAARPRLPRLVSNTTKAAMIGGPRRPFPSRLPARPSLTRSDPTKPVPVRGGQRDPRQSNTKRKCSPPSAWRTSIRKRSNTSHTTIMRGFRPWVSPTTTGPSRCRPVSPKVSMFYVPGPSSTAMPTPRHRFTRPSPRPSITMPKHRKVRLLSHKTMAIRWADRAMRSWFAPMPRSRKFGTTSTTRNRATTIRSPNNSTAMVRALSPSPMQMETASAIARRSLPM